MYHQLPPSYYNSNNTSKNNNSNSHPNTRHSQPNHHHHHHHHHHIPPPLHLPPNQHQYPLHQIPQQYTPIDLNYGHSMIPSNLLISSPYFTPPPSSSTQHPPPPQPPQPPQLQQQQQQQHQFHQYSEYPIPPPPIVPSSSSSSSSAPRHNSNYPVHSSPKFSNSSKFKNRNNGYKSDSSPQLTKITNSNFSNNNSVNFNIDQMNISRTIILRNLKNDIKLNDILNFIDYGPIEYCKLITKEDKNVKLCFITFINSKISINFYLKYTKNLDNFNQLKKSLNSENLKVQLYNNNNQSSDFNRQDLIKLKTLNYILDFKATRSVSLKYVRNDEKSNGDIEKLIHEGCAENGDIEQFIFEDDFVNVHFTSISSAIKTFEKYNKIIKDISNSDCKPDIEFTTVSFSKDRCDRTEIDETETKEEGLKQGESSEVASSIESSELEPDSQPQNDNSSAELVEDPLSPTSSYVEPASYLYHQEFNNSTISNEGYSVISTNSRFNNNPVPFDYFNHSNSSLILPNFGFDNNNNYPNSNVYKNIGNRSIYLGNLHPHTTIEEIANNIRVGGLVESIRHHPDKKVCFVTFVDANVAYRFYTNHQTLHQLVIHGYDVIVAWAKQNSGPLSRDIALAVTAGACRNVYIGIKLIKNETTDGTTPKPKPKLPNEEELRRDFSKFGEMEQINFYHNKDCGFLNFLNISDAIKLVDTFQSNNEDEALKRLCKIFKCDESNDEVKQFYDKYKQFKISFGKDRCANNPKFSFQKRFDHENGNGNSTYKYFQSQLHQNVKNRNQWKKKSPETENVDEKVLVEEEKNVINEEAKKVFGIISGDKGDLSDVDENQEQENGQDENFNEQEDSDDSDDEISIIIDSDTSSIKPFDSTSTSINNMKQPKKYKKIYHNNYSNLSFNTSRNSSTSSFCQFPVLPPQQQQPIIKYIPVLTTNYIPSQPPQSYSFSGSDVMNKYLNRMHQVDPLIYQTQFQPNNYIQSEYQPYNNGYKKYNDKKNNKK